MRNRSLILIIAIMVLIGCKPRTKSSLELKTTDSSKTTTKGLTMPDVGDLKNNTSNNNNNTNSASTWSKAFLSKNLSDCITRASNRLSASQAYTYCDCMMDKIQQKYPNENDAETKFTKEELVPIDAACLPADVNQNNSNDNQTNNNNQNNSNYSRQWSTSDQREFMNNCVPGASKTLGNTGATDYCSCVMNKIMAEYPDSKDARNIPKDHMTSLANDCLASTRK